VSIGVAIYPAHGAQGEQLLQRADLALYAAKHKGKNQVSLYSEDLK
jgi:diguanylate cyclase (GGDEF)-like protein